MQFRVRATHLIVGLLLVFGLALVGCSRKRAAAEPRMRSVMPPAIGRPLPRNAAPKLPYLMVRSESSSLPELELDVPVPMMVDREFTTEREPDGDFIGSPAVEVKPYRTFIEVQRYEVENNGEDPQSQPISNIQLVVTFPKDPADPEKDAEKVELPGNGQYWPIGNGQVQEIGRVFELPWRYVQNDGFKFEIQMIRKGSWMKPCEFEVAQLSEFNRAYVCKTELEWQRKRGVPEERLDKEGVQIRVFTDLNTPKRQVPQNAIAVR